LPPTSEAIVTRAEEIIKNKRSLYKRLDDAEKAADGGAGATAGSKWEVEGGTPKKKVATGAAKWKD
jgi:hypothetical protein